MLKKHAVEGFDDFKAKAEVLSKEDLPLFVYFSGSKTGDGKFTQMCVKTGSPRLIAQSAQQLKSLTQPRLTPSVPCFDKTSKMKK